MPQFWCACTARDRSCCRRTGVHRSIADQSRMRHAHHRVAVAAGAGGAAVDVVVVVAVAKCQCQRSGEWRGMITHQKPMSKSVRQHFWSAITHLVAGFARDTPEMVMLRRSRCWHNRMCVFFFVLLYVTFVRWHAARNTPISGHVDQTTVCTARIKSIR